MKEGSAEDVEEEEEEMRVVKPQMDLEKPKPKKRVRAFVAAPEAKTCTMCLKTKELEEFNRSIVNCDGLYDFCRLCKIKSENPIKYKRLVAAEPQ